MPTVSLEFSPLAPGVSPVDIYCRDEGEGPPLILLHGGWGYSLNPFDRQIEKLRRSFRVVCPDRSGYGASTRIVNDLPPDFHHHAAAETLSLLDALGIESAYFWGHSDGAVIAAMIGFTAPRRVRGLILEAFHYFRSKPRSRAFFEALAYRPESLGAELCEKFALEFGAEYWRQMITGHAKAWEQIALARSGPQDDLYGGRLYEITAPTLFIHGRHDQRTEPEELDAIFAQLPGAEKQILEAGAHCPHSETLTADLVTKIAVDFLNG
ncbi:MAG TPA: alpha/beta hydrolase [Pyrinomonadaceae bacterium]|jgi:pimeloyl-ACP methyl ester carboxylesterase